VPFIAHSETEEVLPLKTFGELRTNEVSINREVHIGRYIQKFKYVGLNVVCDTSRFTFF
jgi:hypothetical protein